MVGDYEKAIGALVFAWITAQEFWVKNQSPIPNDKFKDRGLSEHLITVGLADRTETGVYMRGAEEQFQWILLRQEAGRSGAKAANASKLQQKSANASKLQQKSPSSSFSISSSFSDSFSDSNSNSEEEDSSDEVPDRHARRPRSHSPNPLNVKIWEAYSEEYKLRYKTLPVRNLTVNSQISNLGKRLGEEAIDVIRFYVNHNQRFYVQTCHAVGPCLKDAEALRTQWARNRPVMSTEATSVDKSQSNANSWDYAAKVLAAEKEQKK